MGLLKFDHPPLLAPGRHFLSLSELFRIGVKRFEDEGARAHREKLFYSMEEMYQTLVVAKVPCDFIVDGSFLTEKARPSDIDVKVFICEDAHSILSDEQHLAYNAINDYESTGLVDSSAYVKYPLGHECVGSGLDLGNQNEDYALEHSGMWLKGFAVLMVAETDVGIRIRSRACPQSLRFGVEA